MTNLNTEARELTIDELDSASGGLSFLGVIGAVARIILTGYGIDPYPRKIS
jgi:hypothetical protein